MVVSAKASQLLVFSWLSGFAVIQGLGVWAGFGPPVFIILCIIAMVSFGTREKWSHEDMSAYSVFNEGQAHLLGDRTAAQLEHELRGGFGAASSEGPRADGLARSFKGPGHVIGGVGASSTAPKPGIGQGSHSGDVAAVSGLEDRRQRAAAAALRRFERDATNH